MIKMRTKIVSRRIHLPKELLEKAKLPENGSCESMVLGDEIIRRPESGVLRLWKVNSFLGYSFPIYF